MKTPEEKFFETTKMIIMFSIFSRILVLFKETLIANKIDCCYKTDAYFIALAGLTVFTEILGEGISTSMVPVLIKIENKEGKDKKNSYVNNILHIIILLGLMLMGLGWIFSPLLMGLLARGFRQEEVDLAIRLMKMGLPMVLFILVRAVFVAFLQSNHAFRAGARSWVYNNTVYIIYLFFFNQYGIQGLMVAGILASLSQLFSIIPVARDMGYKYSFTINFKNPYIRELGLFLIPIVLALSVNRVNLLIDKSMASNLPKGSVSYLNYADNIIQLILGIFITAIVTVLFPIISENYSRDNWEESQKMMAKGVGIILAITIPATLILSLFSQPLVRLIFEREAFGPGATAITSRILVYYALGLTSSALVLILTKVHYAIYDAKTPTLISLIGVILNLVLNIILSNHMGIGGIALATSISTTVVVGLLLMELIIRSKQIKSSV